MIQNTAANRDSSKYLILTGVTIVVILIDQWTKMWILSRFQLGDSIACWEPVFALTYVRNTGAAFGLLHRAPSWFREPFFIIVPVVALFFIFALYYQLSSKEKLTAVSLSLILGGALGNLIDRLRFGFVVDFLDFHWREVYHWPAFNIADSGIVVGVSILFARSLLVSENPESTPTESQSTSPLS